ncbi:ISL3 family transposase [Halochromatium sp.]
MLSTEHRLFTAALGLSAPWGVSDVRFDAEAGRIDFEVDFAKGSRFTCPGCGAEHQAVHDTRKRTWRHLHFFQYEAYIHARLPRVRCQQCGQTTQVAAPWARPGSGFTQLFEALLVTLSASMPVNTVARLLGVGDDAIWRVLGHYVERARQRADYSAVRAVGVDETASRRGQRYITLFHDFDGQRLLFACEGRDQRTVEQFAHDLTEHGGDPKAVSAVCMDMSAAYQAGARKHLPNAEITFDAFHVIQLANEALEQVRRAEVKSEPGLRHSRWIWLKDRSRWNTRQINQFHDLRRSRLKTTRAWHLKEALRELYACAADREHAAILFNKWYQWARRCRLEPFKRLALTLKKHLQGVLNAFDSRLSNGRVEGINSLIQAAKARARGYRTSYNLITMAYLIAGKLVHLPSTPYRRPTKPVGALPASI